jgi:signal transduction histidine kinase/DNA-binding response OmpR family regulator
MNMPDDKVNILIVDDQPDKLLALEAVLEELGENVVKAHSGREALRRLLEQEFAVILLDINMPDMDGFETAGLIRQHPRSAHTPIIFVTAYSDDMLANRGYQLGAVDYVLSPVVPAVLRTKVSVFVELFRKTEQAKRQAESQVALAREQAARAAAEESTRRFAFLADISALVAENLHSDSMLDALARHVLSFPADAAAVVCFDDNGHSLHTHLAWHNERGAVESADDSGCSLLDPELVEPFWRVLSGQTSEVIIRAETPSPSAHERNGHAWLPKFAPRVTAIIPLRARNAPLGAIALVMGPSGRDYLPADISLVKEVAARVGTGLENARLYRNIQENDRRKNEFLAMLAHELRNPLAPIRSACDILGSVAHRDGDLLWVQEVISRQLQHLVRLVDDLLDISRITRGKITLQKQTVDVADVISRAVETSRPLVEARGHELCVEVGADPLHVMADPIRLAQVVGNLLNNAAKYTEPGGKICVSGERSGEQIVIRVRDSGIGIPATMLGSVFDLFTQVERSLDRSQGGLGIGLTLVRSLVELHGGAVEAHSAGPGQGSEFVVSLPALAASEVARSRPSDRDTRVSERPDRPWRILLVDDNVDAADTLSTLLQLYGHETCVCRDGPSALEQAEAYQPDLILLDIGLPGMDGYEVARRLRALPSLRDVTIAAVTGYGRVEDQQHSRASGIDHHLIKPVDVGALQRLMIRREPSPVFPAPVDHHGLASVEA